MVIARISRGIVEHAVGRPVLDHGWMGCSFCEAGAVWCR